MARPMTLNTSGASVSGLAVLCGYVSPFSVTVNTVVTGTVVYTLQYTNDNVQAAAYTPAGGNWKDHPMMTGATTSNMVVIESPVTAVRLNQASGAGSVAAIVQQAGL